MWLRCWIEIYEKYIYKPALINASKALKNVKCSFNLQ